jgi:hypothetical protein
MPPNYADQVTEVIALGDSAGCMRRFAAALSAVLAAALMTAGGASAQIAPVDVALPLPQVDPGQLANPVPLVDGVKSDLPAQPAVPIGVQAPPARAVAPAQPVAATPEPPAAQRVSVARASAAPLARSAPAGRTSSAFVARTAERAKLVQPRRDLLARPPASREPAFEPGSGGPSRTAEFLPLWVDGRRSETFLGALRVIAAIGALLALSGVLARRMTDSGLPS